MNYQVRIWIGVDSEGEDIWNICYTGADKYKAISVYVDITEENPNLKAVVVENDTIILEKGKKGDD